MLFVFGALRRELRQSLLVVTSCFITVMVKYCLKQIQPKKNKQHHEKLVSNGTEE